MKFKHVAWGILLRVALIFAIMLASVYCFEKSFYPQLLSLGILIIALIWELASYLTRSNQETARFLTAIKNRDFSLQFTERNTRSDLPQLHQAFNQLNQTFTQLQIEKEAQFHLLQTILQIIDTGIIAYDENGEVLWMNDAFRKALKLPHLKSIQALEKRNETLYQTLKNLQPGQSELVKLKTGQNQMQLLVSATDFKMHNRKLTLLAFKNVSNTVDQAETEAWQKLLRVMTHEIMNSVAPISSLADTMLRHLKLEKENLNITTNQTMNREILDDTEEVLSIIHNRSEGLLQFAQTYRDLSKATNLNLTTVYVEELLNSVYTFMKNRLAESNIKFQSVNKNLNLTLHADPHLLEQVLINLILNAEKAVKNSTDPTISVRADQAENGGVKIEIEDNGTGIPEELLDSIFIPFFTTHKDGSGIGLSLAKQVMTLHKGSIQVKSEENAGTTFTLLFNPAT